MEVIKSDNYEIYKLEKSIYKIKFRYTEYSLVNSLVKSRLIMGSSTEENYKMITFKAESVKTFRQYMHDYEVRTGKKSLINIRRGKNDSIASAAVILFIRENIQHVNRLYARRYNCDK